MDQLGERVAKLEASSEETAGRLLTLEQDVSVLKKACVTKSDLSEAKTEILVKIAETEGELRNEINGVECRLKIEIKGLGHAINDVESRLRTEINGMRQDLRTEISQAKNWILFWVVASVLLAHFLPTF